MTRVWSDDSAGPVNPCTVGRDRPPRPSGCRADDTPSVPGGTFQAQGRADAAVTGPDGTPIGDGRPGPAARALLDLLEQDMRTGERLLAVPYA